MRGGGRLRANPGGLNIKTLGRREGAGKIKGLRRGGFGPRRRAAGRPGRPHYCLPRFAGQTGGQPSRLKLNSN